MGKRIREASKLIEAAKEYALDDALSVLGQYAQKFKTKFDEAVDVAFKLGVDPKDTNNMVRGIVAMPNGLGKTVKVCVITKPDRVDEAKKAGADIFGSEELIDEIKNGRCDFDVCIATPDMMASVSKVGKILGPKGLMPNPKLGTVSDDIKVAIKNAKAGQVEFKIEKAAIVHGAIGKLSFTSKALKENFVAFYEAVQNAKPNNVKGIYLKGVYLTTSMGPSIKLDLSRIVG